MNAPAPAPSGTSDGAAGSSGDMLRRCREIDAQYLRGEIGFEEAKSLYLAALIGATDLSAR